MGQYDQMWPTPGGEEELQQNGNARVMTVCGAKQSTVGDVVVPDLIFLPSGLTKWSR